MSGGIPYNNRVKIVEDTSTASLWNLTAFNERKIAEKTQQFILNANIPLSDQRDNITTANNASVTKVGSEYRLRATTDANSKAILESRTRGNYISGNEAEVGLGIRVPEQPTGDAVIKWGYFDDVSGSITGVYVRYDVNGLAFVVENEGTILYESFQKEWNTYNFYDASDGNLLDPSEGLVYQIRFVYYGYGAITLEIGDRKTNDRYNVIPVDLTKISGQTSISEPNLPLTVLIDSGTTGVQLDAFVGGRQFSTFGKEKPLSRFVGDYRLELANVNTTFLPLVSFRERSGYENILVQLNRLTIFSSADLIYQIRVNGTLTGASFGNPDNFGTNEVATEWDTSATAITGGVTVKAGLIDGSNQSTVDRDNLPKRTIFEGDTYTLCVRRVSGTNATVTAFFEVEEFW